MPGICQISVFAQNKPGKIEKITGILATEKINILALTISSSNGFGIIRLIVDDPDRADAALRKSGLLVSRNRILAIEMEDRPGGLHRVVGILSRNGVNVENTSVFIPGTRERAYLVIEVADPEKTRETLESEGLTLLESTCSEANRGQGPA